MTPRGQALAVTGLALGAVTLGAVAGLLHRTARPTLEIGRYVDAIKASIEDIATNLEATSALERTRHTVGTVAASVEHSSR